MARGRIQLQHGTVNVASIPFDREGVTYLEVAMGVRTLHANNAYRFDPAGQRDFESAVTKICDQLRRARESRFSSRAVRTATKFQALFRGRLDGTVRSMRIDVEVTTGELAF